MLILGLEQTIDLRDKIAQVEGLGQQLGIRRRPAALECDCGKTGDEHDADLSLIHI